MGQSRKQLLPAMNHKFSGQEERNDQHYVCHEGIMLKGGYHEKLPRRIKGKLAESLKVFSRCFSTVYSGGLVVGVLYRRSTGQLGVKIGTLHGENI